MAFTAAQYKTKWEAMQASAVSYISTPLAFGGGTEKAVAAAQIAATWAFLYIEKSRMEIEGFVLSTLAKKYQNDCEARLASAAASLSQPPAAVGWSIIASNLAYAFVEQVRVDVQKAMP